MRKDIMRRLLATGLVAVLTATVPVYAASTQDSDTDAQSFKAADASSFAGAFLAARTADYDNDGEAAIEFYRRALDFAPDNQEVRQRLMITLFMTGRFEEGLVLAVEMKNDPAVDRITAIARGIDAIRKKEFAEAEKLLAYNGPNDLDRLLNGLLAAWARFGTGKVQESLAMIDSLEGPDWYDIFKSYHSGAMAAASGDDMLARQRFKSTITDMTGGGTAPDTFVRAVMALATLEAENGNKRAALDALATGDQFTPGYSPLVALRHAIESDAEIENQVETAAQGAAAVLQSIGSALNRDGAEEIVSLYLRFSRALDPSNANTLVMLGGLAEKMDKHEEAIRIYSEVDPDSPMHRLSELQLSLNLADLDRSDEATKRLEKLIEEDPSDIRAYIALGSVYSDTKNYSAMADAYDQAVEAIGPVPNRGHWNVFFQRGIAYERLKEWEKAEPNFLKALQLYPNQPQVLNYLGYSWIDMNMNLEKGMDMIRTAVELRPNDGFIVDSLGWAHYRLGDYASAVTELERAIELRPEDPTINDHLGDAYWRVGRRIEAVYQWNRALANDPEKSEISKIRSKVMIGLPQPKEPVQDNAEAAKPAPEAPEVKPAPEAGSDEKTEAAPATEKPKPAAYVVKPGETLWNIATDVMGDGSRFRDILSVNPDLKGDPNRIYPGQTIVLPTARP